MTLAIARVYMIIIIGWTPFVCDLYVYTESLHNISIYLVPTNGLLWHYGQASFIIQSLVYFDQAFIDLKYIVKKFTVLAEGASNYKCSK